MGWGCGEVDGGLGGWGGVGGSEGEEPETQSARWRQRQNTEGRCGCVCACVWLASLIKWVHSCLALY